MCLTAGCKSYIIISGGNRVWKNNSYLNA